MITSPGIFTVTATTPGEAEQIDVRAIYILKNDEVSSYSEPKTAFIAP